MSQVFSIPPAPFKTLGLIGLFAFLMAVMFCLSLFIAYSTLHVRLELSQTELRIRGDLYGRSIPLTALIPSQALTLDLSQTSSQQPKWRTNGIGLPGYRSGWFKLNNGEKALLFVTDPHQVVYLPTNEDYSLLISLQEPEKFIDSLKEIK